MTITARSRKFRDAPRIPHEHFVGPHLRIALAAFQAIDTRAALRHRVRSSCAALRTLRKTPDSSASHPTPRQFAERPLQGQSRRRAEEAQDALRDLSFGALEMQVMAARHAHDLDGGERPIISS